MDDVYSGTFIVFEVGVCLCVCVLFVLVLGHELSVGMCLCVNVLLVRVQHYDGDDDEDNGNDGNAIVVVVDFVCVRFVCMWDVVINVAVCPSNVKLKISFVFFLFCRYFH